MAQGAEDRNRRGGVRRSDRLADEFANGLRPTDGEWLESLRSLAPPDRSDPSDSTDPVPAEVVAQLTRIEAAVAEASFTSRSVLLMFGSVQAALEAVDERVHGLEVVAGARDAATATFLATQERGIEALASSVSELSDAVARLALSATAVERAAPDGPVWDEVNQSVRRLAEVARRRLRTGTESGRPGDQIPSQLGR